MEVTLTPDQEAFIQHRVSAGVYATADEAVRAAIALLEEREGGVLGDGTPFRPNAETVEAMMAARRGEFVGEAGSVEELMADLHADD
jgi:putative addiction module CopG family antidote